MSWVRRIRRVGRLAEPAPPRPPAADTDPALRGSLVLRHVDAGSCNGCEVEIAGCFSPVYDIERHGVRLTASPRHADGLLVTGVVTHNMRQALLDAYDATPEPKVVIAVGDCARNCGELAGGPGVAGAVGEVVPIDLEIAGCPPTPDQIVASLRGIVGR